MIVTKLSNNLNINEQFIVLRLSKNVGSCVILKVLDKQLRTYRFSCLGNITAAEPNNFNYIVSSYVALLF